MSHVAARARQRHRLRVSAKDKAAADQSIAMAKLGWQSAALLIAAKTSGNGEIWSVLLRGQRVRVVWANKIVTVLPKNAYADKPETEQAAAADAPLINNPAPPTLGDIFPSQAA